MRTWHSLTRLRLFVSAGLMSPTEPSIQFFILRYSFFFSHQISELSNMLGEDEDLAVLLLPRHNVPFLHFRRLISFPFVAPFARQGSISINTRPGSRFRSFPRSSTCILGCYRSARSSVSSSLIRDTAASNAPHWPALRSIPNPTCWTLKSILHADVLASRESAVVIIRPLSIIRQSLQTVSIGRTQKDGALLIACLALKC